MKLLLLKLKLAFHLGIFLLRLAANFSNKAKPLIIGIFVTGLLALIGGISLLNTAQKPVQAVFTVVPQNTELFELQSMTKEQVESQIIFLEQIVEKQPNSRDILLNLSHLYSALHQEEQAIKYREAAVVIDPNNPLFE